MPRRPETWVSLCNLMLKLCGISHSSAILGSDSPQSNNRKGNCIHPRPTPAPALMRELHWHRAEEPGYARRLFYSCFIVTLKASPSDIARSIHHSNCQRKKLQKLETLLQSILIKKILLCHQCQFFKEVSARHCVSASHCIFSGIFPDHKKHQENHGKF